MNRTAVFVDAGYLFAEGARLIGNEVLPRSELRLEHGAVLKLLGDLTHELTGLPLLRIYWYDAATNGPSPQQLALAYRPNVKLRLGVVDQHGQQSGVDALIIADLIELARNRAMADAVLLTGDEDLRVGVQQAQEFGVRVHLLGIAPSMENQSRVLVQEADTVRELTAGEVESVLTRVSSPRQHAAPLGPAGAPAQVTASRTVSADALEGIAQGIAGELSEVELAAVHAALAGGAVPPHIDRRLLIACTQAAGAAPLTSEQKRRLRSVFLAACRALAPQ